MKFFAAIVCTLFVAQAIALPFAEEDASSEFDAALETAAEEETVRVQRNVGYGQPSKGYSAPAKHSAPSYGHQEHSYGGHQSYGHAQTHAYAVAAPKAKCGHNLLFSCAPSVAHVPCQPHHGGGYGHKESHGYSAPSYKAAGESYGAYGADEEEPQMGFQY